MKDINAGSETEEEITADEVKTICSHLPVKMLLYQHFMSVGSMRHAYVVPHVFNYFLDK